MINYIMTAIIRNVTGNLNFHVVSVKKVRTKIKSVQCDSYNFWIHKSCEGLTDDEFQKLVEEDDDIPFSCLTCKIKQNCMSISIQ